jgi:hypothetical protein
MVGLSVNYQGLHLLQLAHSVIVVVQRLDEELVNGAGGNVKSCKVVKKGAKVVRVVVTLVAQCVAYSSVLVGEMMSSCLGVVIPR